MSITFVDVAVVGVVVVVVLVAEISNFHSRPCLCRDKAETCPHSAHSLHFNPLTSCAICSTFRVLVCGFEHMSKFEPSMLYLRAIDKTSKWERMYIVYAFFTECNKFLIYDCFLT